MLGFDKSPTRARDAWKMHFCAPRPVSARAHYKLRFENAEWQSGRSGDNRIQKFSEFAYLKDES